MFTVGSIYKRKRFLECCVIGRNTSCVSFGLVAYYLLDNIYFLTFGFKHTYSLSVDEQEIVNLLISFQQSLSYSNSSAISFKFIAIDNFPTSVRQPFVNLYPRFFFRLHIITNYQKFKKLQIYYLTSTKVAILFNFNH